MAGGPAVLKFARGLPTSTQFGERLRLLVIQGPDKGTCFSIIGDLIFIGREGCQINLNDTNISKKHAEIGWDGAQYFIRDLGSANGIVYNGKRLPEAKLKAGDLLMFGLSVLEVYTTGQTKRNDRPLLPEGARRPQLAGPVQPPITGADLAVSPEDEKKKRENAKKRLLIFAGLFFLAFILYFSDTDTTIRDNAQLPKGEEDVATGKKVKKKTKKEIEEALAEYMPNYSLDTQQRKDAEIFFRNGAREMQNKNFRRAFTAFETALTVDPTHELAKIYLKSAKMQMLADLESTQKAGKRAFSSLRYKEARMHYDNIIRFMDGEAGGNDYMDQDSNTKLKKVFDEAKEGLEKLDKEENKLK